MCRLFTFLFIDYHKKLKIFEVRKNIIIAVIAHRNQQIELISSAVDSWQDVNWHILKEVWKKIQVISVLTWCPPHSQGSSSRQCEAGAVLGQGGRPFPPPQMGCGTLPASLTTPPVESPGHLGKTTEGRKISTASRMGEERLEVVYAFMFLDSSLSSQQQLNQ